MAEYQLPEKAQEELGKVWEKARRETALTEEFKAVQGSNATFQHMLRSMAMALGLVGEFRYNTETGILTDQIPGQEQQAPVPLNRASRRRGGRA